MKYIINNICIDIYNFLKKYDINNTFVISYSGGIDSTFLLEILFLIKKNIFKKFKFKAIHINHNINNNSNEWLNHCIKICNNKKIYIYYDNIYIKKYNNIENNLRILRYKAISKKIKKNEILLTAHNQNDKIENFFLFIKRSSSIIGLSNIKNYRKLFNIKILSPLLNYNRDKIFKILNFLNLHYINDDSNNNIYFDRNYIRYKIIPILNNRWKNFNNILNKSIDLINNNFFLLNNFIKNNINKFIYNDKSLNLNSLLINNIYIKHIILYWLKINNIKYTYNLINFIFKIIFNKNLYNIIILKNKNIIKYKNNILCVKKNKKNNKIFINYNKIKNINNCIKFNNGYIKIFLNIKELFKLYYKYKNVNFIKLRKLKKNENIYINYYNNIEDIKCNFIGFGNKKIIELFQLLNIPIYYRNNIPLIFYNNNLMAILKFSIIKKEENINNNFIYILYKIWN